MIDRTTQFQLFLLVLVLGFLLGPRVIEALQRLPLREEAPAANLQNVAAVAEQSKKVIAVDPFAKVTVSAKSVYVWDINTHRKLYAINADIPLPLASVTKIMTALVASDILPRSDKVTIGTSDLFAEGDTGLYAGEIWTFEKLLAFTLVASSNDGASAIARAGNVALQEASSTASATNKDLFILQMNKRAWAIGLTQTTFRNESGLDVAGGENGGEGTARDIAMLFEYVFHKHPELLLPTSSRTLDLRSESGIVHHIANTNQDVSAIPGIIGSKTGYTDLAGGNLVIIVDIGINHPVVIAVLGSTRDGRFTDVKQLIAAATEAITGVSGH